MSSTPANPRSGTRFEAVVPEYLPGPQLETLAGRAHVVYDPDLHADRALLLRSLSGTDALLIRNRTVVDVSLLAAAPRLSVVGRLGVGLDNVDLVATAEAGVEVIAAHGGNAVSVAEYVMGAMLNLARPVFGMTPSMVAGEWPRQGHAFGRELDGQTLGLIGLGRIAREVARRARAFAMEILAHDPFVPETDPAWGEAERIDLSGLLARSDVVSVHVPLGEGTRELVSEEAIAIMKPDAILINTSRGGVVDEQAVAAALRSGRLGGAALDVFTNEPLGPEAGAMFSGAPNLILTPHLAGNTQESVERIATMTVEAVLAALERLEE